MSRSLDRMTDVALCWSAQTDNQCLRFIFVVDADSLKRQFNGFRLCSGLISTYLETCNPTLMLFAEDIEEAGPFVTRNFSRAHLTSHSSGKGFRWLPSLPKSKTFQRFKCLCLVKVDDCVKLFGKASIKIMTLSFSLRQIDDSDSSLKSWLTNSPGARFIGSNGQQKIRTNAFMEQAFVTLRQRRPHS